MRRDGKALLCALTAVLLWSTVASAFKIALRHLSPLDMLILACLWSTLALGAVLLKTEPSAFRITPGQWGYYLLGAVLNPAAYYLVLFESYDLLPAQVAQPLNYTWPLMLVILSIPLLGKKPRAMDMFSLLICFGGVILISRGGNGEGSGAYDRRGMGLALLSAVLWAGSWLSAQRRKEREEKRLFWNFLLALPPLLLLKPFVSPGLPAWSPAALLSTIWIGLFEMGITFLFWGYALKLSSHPARIGSLAYLSPFLSLIWISLILQERIATATIAGLAVIVGGILLKGIRRSGNDSGRRSGGKISSRKEEAP